MKTTSRSMIGGIAVGFVLGAALITALDTPIITAAHRQARSWEGIAASWKEASDRFEKVANTSMASWKDCVEYYSMFDLTLKPAPKPKGTDL